MLDPVSLVAFAAAALLLLVTPGPAVLYIVGRSLHEGRTAGLVSVLGIHLGTLVHVAAAVLGLSALLASSALAFRVVTYLGAVYLIGLGLRTLLGRDRPVGPTRPRRASLGRTFLEGAIVNLLNPKTALFFLAFLPQFVDPSRGSAPAQMLLLGLVFVALGLLSDGGWALLAGTLGGWLGRRRPGVRRAQRYSAGGVYLTLGVATMVSDASRP
jgi:threonine/homoserine/homoserine lactone efflux protein